MNHLGLFAKFWQPGTVKTRLAASIGNQAACSIYRALLTHMIDRHQQSAGTRTVVFSPAETKPEFRSAIPGCWELAPQSTGDLGDRMKAFFESQIDLLRSMLGPGADQSIKVVVIGADCPQLDVALVHEAFDLLDQAPVVIGPSTDGGYYLLAMRDTCLNIFSEVPWGTSSVFADTVKRLQQLGVEYHTLAPLSDVDELEDLLALEAELVKQRDVDLLDRLDRKLLDQIQIVTSALSDSQKSGV